MDFWRDNYNLKNHFMKFQVLIALAASATAIKMSALSMDLAEENDPTEELPAGGDLVAQTNNKKHLIGTHYLLHAEKDIENLINEAKNAEHDANTDKIAEVKEEIAELKGHLDILNADHENHKEVVEE